MNKFIPFLIIISFSFVKGLSQETKQFGINKSYQLQIDSLIKLDQKVRSRKNIRAKKIYFKQNVNSKIIIRQKKIEKATKIYKNWMRTDSLIIWSLIDLINQNGFPSKERVGIKGYYNAHVIMLHFDRDTNNYILAPILSKALKNNEITPIDYALIIDRHFINTGYESVYFTWNPCNFLSLSEKRKKDVLNSRHKIGLFNFSFKCGLLKHRTIIE